jgi:hypothetical protein
MSGHPVALTAGCPDHCGERGVMVARPDGKRGGAGSIPAAHPNQKHPAGS